MRSLTSLPLRLETIPLLDKEGIRTISATPTSSGACLKLSALSRCCLRRDFDGEDGMVLDLDVRVTRGSAGVWERGRQMPEEQDAILGDTA